MPRTPLIARFALLAFFPLVVAAPAQTPAVARFEPANGSADAAAGRTTLRVVFDRDMDRKAGLTIMQHPQGLPFPQAEAQPDWADARTLEFTAVLEAGTEYGCVLNASGSSKRFRDTEGNILPPTEWRFTVAGSLPGEPVDAEAMRAWNEHAVERLQRAILEQYSYRDRTGTDWRERFAQQRGDLLAAPSRRQYTALAAKLLAPARDPHLWFQFLERIVGTHQTGAQPNWNPRLLAKLPGFTQQNRNVVSARTDDGIGYVAVATFDRKLRDDVRAVQQVLADLRECKALILDVRGNGGGDENLAKEIAAWFVDGERVYAGHRFVDANAEGGFGPVQQRTLTGNTAPEQRFQGRVAVLAGPVNLSSCEAFLLMMKQCERALLVGARSGGSSGNPQPVQLGEGVVLMVPSWQALRPDGTCFEGEGIAPDVEVAATAEQLKSRDPVLAKAMELLRQAR
jgi:hypothetical protein